MAKSFYAFLIVFFLLFFSHISSNAQAFFTSITPITSTTVGIWQKFEVGIATSPSTFSNPYDSAIVDVYAQFTSPSGHVYRRNGFWYQDFVRNASIPCPPDANYPSCFPTPNYLDEDTSYLHSIATPNPWRIRFSTNEVGVWTYKITVNYSHASTVSSTYSFTVTNNITGKRLAKVGSNQRYFSDENGNSLFPIGMDVNNFANGISGTQFVYNRMPYTEMIAMIDRLSAKGANLMRTFMSPDRFGIEWNEPGGGLGNYGPRQNRMYDLDKVFEEAENKNVFIQLCLIAAELTPKNTYMPDGSTERWWNDLSPYHTATGAVQPVDFFSNPTCIHYFQNKLRYIIARWDYSPSLFAYEFDNEIDLLINNDGSDAFWNMLNYINILNWHSTMAQYARCATVNSAHMFTTSVGLGDALAFNDPAGRNLLNLSGLDFSQDHNYSDDKGITYQDNYLTKWVNKEEPNKPFFLGEFGQLTQIYDGDYIGTSGWGDPTYYYSMFHNVLWSSVLSGQSASALYWGVGGIYPTAATCSPSPWGGQESYFLPLSAFMAGEDLSNGEVANAIANTWSGEGGPIDDKRDTIPNMPWFLKSFDPFSRYTANTITTSDDNDIEVFGLKRDNEILGWVHNKNNYWANLPYHDDNTGVSHTLPLASPITTLHAKTITISNLLCDGLYKIDFYNTYGSGGIVSTLTNVPDPCGTITFTIPDLGYIDGSGRYPDYAFKITKQSDSWDHNFISNTTDQAINGAIAAGQNHVVYAGVDNKIHHLYPSGGINIYDNSWAHFIYDDGGDTNQHINGDIAIKSDATQVAYCGADHRLQEFYYDGSLWHHIWQTDWSGTSQNISSSDPQLAMAPSGTPIVYPGTESKIHEYYWNTTTSSWVHTVIDPSSTDPELLVSGDIQITDDGYHVVYVGGTDHRLQEYYYTTSTSTWTHFPLSDGSGTQNVGGAVAIASAPSTGDHIFYIGTDGYLHVFIWIPPNTWTHYKVTDALGNPFPAAINGGLTCSPDAQNVYYKGSDGYVQHLYSPTIGTYGPTAGGYSHDYITCYNDLTTNMPTANPVTYWTDGTHVKVFYGGIYHDVQVYYYNQGCMPRADIAERTVESTTKSVGVIKCINDSSSNFILKSENVYQNTSNTVIYPNPFSDNITVEMSDVDNDVIISDAIGRDIMNVHANIRTIKLNTGDIMPGMYILTIKKNGIITNTFKISKYK